MESIYVEHARRTKGARAGRTASSVLAACLLATTTTAIAGDVQRGRALFGQCASCHQMGPEAENAVGPHLNELFGRRAGSVEGATYSDDLLRAGRTGLHWDHESLDVYIADPRSLVSGTRMQFQGVADPVDRADLIAYLREFSASPRDIPEAARTADPTPHDPAVDPKILALQGDPEFGEYLAGECVTCHQASGEDEGIPSIVGWPSKYFVIAMHAYRSKARRHPVMQLVAAPLNDEEIAALAAYFSTLE